MAVKKHRYRECIDKINGLVVVCTVSYLFCPVLMDCWTMFFDNYLFILCACAGSSVSGYDDTPSDNSTADAADPSAASPEPSAAPGSSPAAAGPHVATGNVQLTFMS